MIALLEQVLREVAGVAAAESSDDQPLAEIMDSLELVDLTVEIEGRTGAKLDDDKVFDCRTIGDLSKLIAEATA